MVEEEFEILVFADRGRKTGEPWEKPLEPGETHQQTQPT